MARMGFSLALIVAAFISGCSDGGVPPPDPAKTECRQLEVSGARVRMRVPIGSEIVQDTSRGSVSIRPNPNGRLIRFLSLAPLAGATLPPPERSTTLANGRLVSYSLGDEIGGGSGGPEAELMGEMLLDERTPLLIVCHDQHEDGPQAEWCLSYLGTLEPASSPEACT